MYNKVCKLLHTIAVIEFHYHHILIRNICIGVDVHVLYVIFRQELDNTSKYCFSHMYLFIRKLALREQKTLNIYV